MPVLLLVKVTFVQPSPDPLANFNQTLQKSPLDHNIYHINIIL